MEEVTAAEEAGRRIATRCRRGRRRVRKEGIESCEEQCSTVRATCALTIVRTRRSSSRPMRSSGCRRPASAGRISGPIVDSMPRANPPPWVTSTAASSKTSAALSRRSSRDSSSSDLLPPPTTRARTVGRATRRRAHIGNGSWVRRRRFSVCRWRMAHWSRQRSFPPRIRCPASWRCRMYSVPGGSRQMRRT